MHRAGFFDHHEQAVISGLANATPQFSGTYGTACPQGYVWYIEIVDTMVGGTHNAVVELFVMTTSTFTPSAAGTISDRANRVWNMGAAALNGASTFPNGIYVPSGYFIGANFSGGSLAQNDFCKMTLQIAWHQLLGMEPGMSPQDLRQLEREKATSPVTLPATAEQRATDQFGGGLADQEVVIVNPDPFVGKPN